MGGFPRYHHDELPETTPEGNSLIPASLEKQLRYNKRRHCKKQACSTKHRGEGKGATHSGPVRGEMQKASSTRAVGRRGPREGPSATKPPKGGHRSARASNNTTQALYTTTNNKQQRLHVTTTSHSEGTQSRQSATKSSRGRRGGRCRQRQRGRGTCMRHRRGTDLMQAAPSDRVCPERAWPQGGHGPPPAQLVEA